MDEEYGMNKITVKVKKLDTILERLHEKDIEEVSFEFLVASCFPHILDNIKEEMRRQHAIGYIEGLDANK